MWKHLISLRLQEQGIVIQICISYSDSLNYAHSLERRPSSRRGAAIRARKSINSSGASNLNVGRPSSIAEAEKIIKHLQRHRRARHAKTREFSKAVLDDLDRRLRKTEGSTSQCPICQLQITITEGGETMEEHVDRCLVENAANEAHRLEQLDSANSRVGDELYDMNGETRIRLTSITGFAGKWSEQI